MKNLYQKILYRIEEKKSCSIIQCTHRKGFSMSVPDSGISLLIFVFVLAFH